MMAPQVLRMALQQILDALAAQLKRLLNELMPACRAAGAKIGGRGRGRDHSRQRLSLPSWFGVAMIGAGADLVDCRI
jgi:hypothetical protein